MISVILPIYNGESTLLKTLKSLEGQTLDFDEIIVIDDNSTDGSLRLVDDFFSKKGIKKTIIRHRQQRGLASVYNEGIRTAKGNLIVTLHQDVVLQKCSLKKLVSPFLKERDDEIVLSYHSVVHPFAVWNKYNFWQKVFFARLAGKKFSGMDGKFDCFKKSALLKAGIFDEKNFRTAGEDGDMLFKLGRIGKLIKSEAKIIHLHKIDPNYSFKDVLSKQAQYSEAQGALLRKGRIKGIKNFSRSFFRELLLIFLFLPYVSYFSLFFIFLYAFFYTKEVYFRCYKDKRICFLPLVNILLLFVSFFFSLRGFIRGKQSL